MRESRYKVKDVRILLFSWWRTNLSIKESHSEKIVEKHVKRLIGGPRTDGPELSKL